MANGSDGYLDDDMQRSAALAGVSDNDLMRELVARASVASNGFILGIARPKEPDRAGIPMQLQLEVVLAGVDPNTLQAILRRMHQEVAQRISVLHNGGTF